MKLETVDKLTTVELLKENQKSQIKYRTDVFITLCIHVSHYKKRTHRIRERVNNHYSTKNADLVTFTEESLIENVIFVQ